MHTVYLTIDDAPSENFEERLTYLHRKKIPAIVFVRGDLLDEEGQKKIVSAIQLGFEIGNHSYSHPLYSQTNNEEFFAEILRTESLIDMCFEKANVPRQKKLIRLPFGDRGAGAGLKTASSKEEQDKVDVLQAFLLKQGFENPLTGSSTFVDIHWTWDTKDYKTELKNNPNKYMEELQTYCTARQNSFDIILLHDFGKKFGSNQHLFEPTLEFLIKQGINFATTNAQYSEDKMGDRSSQRAQTLNISSTFFDNNNSQEPEMQTRMTKLRLSQNDAE